MRSAGFSAAAAAGALGLALVYAPVFALGANQVRTGADDFLAFYAGARLLGSPGLYHPGAVIRTEMEAAHVAGETLAYIRPPFLAALVWPLARLPYRPAHWLWLILRMAAVAGFAWWWPHTPRASTAVACCWYLPLAAALANGQDAPLLLLWMAVAERCYRHRAAGAGLALSLCLAKFHLFLPLPVFLWKHRRRLLPGFLAGCAALGLVSFLAAGRAWPREYLSVLRLPGIAPSARLMPNIHGLGLPAAAEIVLSALVAAAAVFAILRLEEKLALAAALLAGVLLSFHAYLADLTILLPGVLVLWARWSAARAGSEKPKTGSA